jgi:hypothetical protein
MNQVILLGHLTQPPEERQTSSDKTVALGALRHGARRRHSLRYTLCLRSPMWRLRRRLRILQGPCGQLRLRRDRYKP